MKYLKPINEIWGPVLKRDLLGETREEEKFHTNEQLKEYLKSEIEKQGENVVIQNLDVSLVEDMSELFYRIAYEVKSLDLSGWKTSGAKNMSAMFWGCYSLESLDVTGWDTSNVENMGHMFYRCDNLKSLDLSSWDTSNVEKMKEMFSYCENLESLDVSGWNTSKVNDMYWMFSYCRKLKSLDLSSWDISNVKNMGMIDMFYNCPALYDNKLLRNNKPLRK